MAYPEEGESQCSASGRTVWVGAGKEQKGTDSSMSSSAVSVTSPLTQVRTQVRSLQHSVSISPVYSTTEKGTDIQ